MHSVCAKRLLRSALFFFRCTKIYWILNEATCLAYYIFFSVEFRFSHCSRYFPLSTSAAFLFQPSFHTHICPIISHQFRISAWIADAAIFHHTHIVPYHFSFRFFTLLCIRSSCIYHRPEYAHDVFVIRKSKYLVIVEGNTENMKHESATAVSVATAAAHCRNRLARIKSILIKRINDICFCESPGGICIRSGPVLAAAAY